MSGDCGPFDLDLQVEGPSDGSEEYVEELGLTSPGGVSGMVREVTRCCWVGRVDNIPIDPKTAVYVRV